jgi:hypothetical protein
MASAWEGEWETEFGDLTLEVNGHVLTGKYEYRNGTIRGCVAGDVATGIWHQSSSEPGGLPWGRFRLELDDDEFEGEWTYGNGTEVEGDWKGEKYEDEDLELGERYVA